MPKRSIPYQPILMADLKDDEIALHFLNHILQDDNPALFLSALKSLCDARGIGMKQLAQETDLSRVSLHKILSDDGNPRFRSIHAVLKQLGFKLQLAFISAEKQQSA